MTSIRDIALKAGVSVATVSRVISNKPHVRPEVRDAVLKVIEEEGYRPSRIASRMRSQSSGVVGLMITDIRNPFFTAIARAIEDVANQHNMNVFLCNTDENSAKEDIYLQALLEERVAGVILSPTRETREPFAPLLDSRVPAVSIDRRIVGANIDGVYSDNFQAAYSLTKHVIEQGYQQIAALFGLKDSMTGHDRMAGHLKALEDHGIKPHASHTQYGPPKEDAGEAVVSGWLKGRHRPDAIITGNSRMTIGALNAIAAAGLSIPGDVALAGFDETAWMRHAGPGITVISQPTYEMGKTAAELLFQRQITPDRPSREVVLQGQLIVRGSTAKKA
jgi:LacI family transcriptional regulator, fructose operon transcriptional repressor